MRYRFAFLAIALMLVSAAAFGQTRKLVLKDGREFVGDITETDDGYQVPIGGGAVVFKKDQVASIENVASPGDEFKDRWAKVPANNAEEFYKLGEWAKEHKLIKEATQALEQCLKLRPDHLRASLLLKQLKQAEQPTTNIAAPPKDPNAGHDTVGAPKELLIEEDDINRIRLEELTRGDRVSIQLRNDVVKRFVDQYRGKDEFENPAFERKFMGLAPADKVSYMLEKIDRGNSAIKDDIRISSDCKAMMDFRNRLWPLIKQSCASSTCHGGEKVLGGIRLFSVAGKNDRVEYTNFVILDGYAKDGKRMFDRNTPEDSIILEFGLPHDQAKFQHPKKLTPIFTSRKAANYQMVLKWIDALVGPPHPDYRLTYQPPAGVTLNMGSSLLNPATTSAPADAPKGGWPWN